MRIDGSLKFIKALNWNEVFSIWEYGEATLPRWVNHYKQRGFASWKEWRTNTILELAPESLQWSLYEVKNPSMTVPLFRGGPFRSWIKNYYEQQSAPTFSQISKNEAIGNSSIINEMVENFPSTTTLIGLKTEEGIIVIEGMHRCTALAFAAHNNIPIKTKINLVLSNFDKEIPIMGQSSSPAA